MKYELRWISPDGKSGRWTGPFATRQEAEEHAALRQMANGLSYTIEEFDAAPEPGSTAAHHVEILRARVKELEAELAEAKASLAKAPSVPVGASEAPREGGDSEPSSFDALEAFLRADTCRSIQAIEDGRFIVSIPGLIGNPASRTLEGIAACVEEMTKSNAEWLKPISRPKDKFGEYTNRWRLNALERFLDGDEAASLTWHEGEFYAVADDVVITATTLLAIADKLIEKKEAKP